MPDSVGQHCALAGPPHDVVTRGGGGGGQGGGRGGGVALSVLTLSGISGGRQTAMAGIVQEIA